MLPTMELNRLLGLHRPLQFPLSHCFHKPTQDDITPVYFKQSPTLISLTREEIQRKAKIIAEEYLSNKDFEAAEQSIEDLSRNVDDVLYEILVFAIMKTVEVRAAIGKLFTELIDVKCLSQASALTLYKKMCDQIVTEEWIIDIPLIWTYFAEFIAPLVITNKFSFIELCIISKSVPGNKEVFFLPLVQFLCQNCDELKQIVVAAKDEENSKVPTLSTTEKDNSPGPFIEKSQPSSRPSVTLKYKYKDDQWSPLNPDGEKKYDREFLLALRSEPISMKKPKNVPNFPMLLGYVDSRARPLPKPKKSLTKGVSSSHKSDAHASSGGQLVRAELAALVAALATDVKQSPSPPSLSESGELKKSVVATQDGEKTCVQVAEKSQPTCAPEDVLNLKYDQDQQSPSNPEAKKKYKREFLLALQIDPRSLKIPNDFPNIDTILRDLGKNEKKDDGAIGKVAEKPNKVKKAVNNSDWSSNKNQNNGNYIDPLIWPSTMACLPIIETSRMIPHFSPVTMIPLEPPCFVPNPAIFNTTSVPFGFTPMLPQLSPEGIQENAKFILEEYLRNNNIQETKHRLTGVGLNLYDIYFEILLLAITRNPQVRKSVGKLLVDLVQLKFLTVTTVLSLYTRLCQKIVSDQWVIGVHLIWCYFAELTAPLVKADKFSFADLSKISKIVNGDKKGFFLPIIRVLCQECGENEVRRKWVTSGVKLSDFVANPNDINLQKVVKFVLTNENPLLPMDDIQKILSTMLQVDTINFDQIIEWINNHVGKYVREPQFIHALTTAICECSINSKKQLINPLLRKHEKLLRKYVFIKDELQVHCLCAIQVYVTKLGQPPGLLMSVFVHFWENSVISNEAFIKWRDSDIVKEGKLLAVKSLEIFFKENLFC